MELIETLTFAIDNLRAGNVVGVGALLTFAIRAYRLIPGAPWPRQQHHWIVLLVTFLVGFLVALLTGVFGFGLTWPAAVMAGLGVATNAIGIHSATQAIGSAVRNAPDSPVESPFRKAASVILPPPRY
jgi:uncharacterized membrane protein